MLIKGPGSQGLCKRLDDSGIDSIEVDTKVFPDGEVYVKLHGDVSQEDCVLVHTSYPNQHLIELIFIMDAVLENGASSLTTVVPYYSYSRQDKAFQPGEGVSARAIAKTIDQYSDRFAAVDLHSKKITDFFSIPAEDLTAMELLAEHAMRYEPDFFLSPDEGAVDRVKIAANSVDLPWDHLKKTRIDASTVEMEPKNMKVEGKSVVILDDIISTGGTMMKAAGQLYRQGADEVHAGCTHGLFVDGSNKKLEEHFDSVFCTDTIEGENSEVTIAPLLLDRFF